MKTSLHEVGEVTFSGDQMLLEVDGKAYRIELAEHSTRLLAASEAERNNCVVSPSGYGIHWPDIDEDLSVDRLVGITHEGPETARSSARAQPQTGSSAREAP